MLKCPGEGRRKEKYKGERKREKEREGSERGEKEGNLQRGEKGERRGVLV